jgi:hypothetical protein
LISKTSLREAVSRQQKQLSAVSNRKKDKNLPRQQMHYAKIHTGISMAYKGIARGNVIEPEGEATLPEGTRVRIIPEQPVSVTVPQPPMTLQQWLREARQVRAQLPKTSDSVEIFANSENSVLVSEE